MKYGVLTDIHANIKALDAVLYELEKRKVDKIICCGDIIGIGPRPEEAVQKIKQIKDKLIAVRGNHEQYLLKEIPKMKHGRDIKKEEEDHHKWTNNNLSKDSIEFLESLPLEQKIQDGNVTIYFSHYPYGIDGNFKKFIWKPNLLDCEELFQEIDADVFLFGHTHIQMFYKNKEKFYINSGALGCPVSSKNAYFGILNIVDNKIDFEKFEIEYDVDSVIEDIKEIKYPLYETIINDFYGVSMGTENIDTKTCQQGQTLI